MRARVGLALAVVLSGCTAERTPPPVASQQRTGAVTSCPRPVVTAVPADLPLVDRRTLNLGDGLFGHKLVYQRTTARRLVVSVGEDPLDALEDLDMEERDAVIAGRPVSVSTTHLQRGLVVVELPDALPEGCGELFAVTERLTPAELTGVVGSLRLSRP